MLAMVGRKNRRRNGNTYGYFRASNPRRSVYAHRFAYAISRGIAPSDLPSETVIRHSCDNPICCNPAHLLPGSQKENAQDMALRGRSLRGEKQPTHKLSESQAKDAKRRIAAGEKHEDIASLFGVSRAAISQIAAGKNWSWLAANDNDPPAERVTVIM